MNLRFTFLFLLISVKLLSQEIGNEDANIVFSINEYTDLDFYNYDPPLQIKADYSDISEVSNQYPELLIQSILSAKNQDWIDSNILGGSLYSSKKSEAHFQKISTMDKDRNYFELHHKITLTLGEIPTTFVKFFFYQEGEKPVSGCYILQKFDGRWYKTLHPSFSTISIAIMRFKTEVLEAVVYNDTSNANVSSLIDRVYTNGSIDLSKLEGEFVSWYRPQIDNRKISQFKDPRTW